MDIDVILGLPQEEFEAELGLPLNDISRLPQGPYKNKGNLENTRLSLQDSLLQLEEGDSSSRTRTAEFLTRTGSAIPGNPIPNHPTGISPVIGTSTRPDSPLGSFGGFAVPPDKISKEQVRGSKYLNLLLAPANPSAEALVDAVLEKVLFYEERTGQRKRKRRKDAEVQLRHAVGAIVGNLLTAWLAARHHRLRPSAGRGACPAGRCLGTARSLST